MRNPIPVTTRSITADSGSRTYDQSMVSPGSPPAGAGPISIQVQAVCDTRWSGADDSAVTAPSDTRNAASTVPHAMTPTTRFDSRAARSPHTTNPANGSSGMSQSRSVIASPAQQADVVDVGGLPAPEERQDDREAHGRLARRDRDHEQREDVADHRLHLVGEGDEGEVRGVQHQLDGHEHDDDVAAHQDPDAADGEQQRRHHQEEIDAHQSSLFLASSTAPTMAAMSSTDAASVAKTYSPNRSVPRSLAVPNPSTKRGGSTNGRPWRCRSTQNRMAANPAPNTTAPQRCRPRPIRSPSSALRLSSMMTNMNRTMIAPA